MPGSCVSGVAGRGTVSPPTAMTLSVYGSPARWGSSSSLAKCQATPSRARVPVPMATPRPVAVLRSAGSTGLHPPGPRRGVGPRVAVFTSGGCRLQGGAHLALEAEQDGGHTAQPQRRDDLRQPHRVVEVVRSRKDLFRGGAVEAGGEDPGEAPGGRGLRRSVEPQAHPVVVADLAGEEERR